MKVFISAFKKDREYAIGITDGFRSLGHNVNLCFPDKFNFIISIAKIATWLPFKNFSESYFRLYKKIVNQKILEKSFSYAPDFFLSIGGEHLLPETIKKIRGDNNDVLAAVWVTDEAAILDINDPYRWLNFSAYTHFFVVDELWGESIQLFPVPRYSLPFAGNPITYKSLNLKKDIDVLFMNDAFLPHLNIASDYVKKLILSELIPKLQEKNLRLKIISRRLSSRKLNHFFNRSQIVIYINNLFLKTDYNAFVYNIASSKSFLITDYKSNAEKLFDGHLVTFKNIDDLITKTLYYINEDYKRKVITDKVFEITRLRHTYKMRAESVLKTLFS